MKSLSITFVLFSLHVTVEAGNPGDIGPSGSSCNSPPRSTYFNLSDVTYDYPGGDIHYELNPRLLMTIYKAGKDNQRRNANTPDNGVQGGCKASKATLEGFRWRNNHCWVLYPKHQAITFVRCGYPKCRGEGYPRCVAYDITKPVWAYCLALPFGQRITRVEIPIPVRCSCSLFTC